MSGETECRSTYFRHLAESEEKLVEFAEELTEKARSLFFKNEATDCRWSPPVRGIHRVVSAVDSDTLEVLEFAILIKNRPMGNYEGVSNNMETIETSMVIDQMKKTSNL